MFTRMNCSVMKKEACPLQESGGPRGPCKKENKPDTERQTVHVLLFFFSHMPKLGIKTKQNDLKIGQGLFGRGLCVSRREDGSAGGSVGVTKA